MEHPPAKMYEGGRQFTSNSSSRTQFWHHEEIQVETHTFDARIVKLLSDMYSLYNSMFKWNLIETAFGFFTSSLQAVKYFWNSAVHNNLELCISLFYFLKEIALLLGGLFNNIWIRLQWLNYADCRLHQLMRKLWGNYNYNLEHGLYKYTPTFVNI